MSSKALVGQRFESQHEDEELLMLFRKHPIVMRRGLMAVLIFMTLGFIPVLFKPTELNYLWFGAVGFAFGGIFLFFDWIAWHFSVYYVTDQRIIQVRHKGLFSRSVSDIGLDKVQSINFKIKGMQAAMFDYGTVVIQMYGGEMVMDKVYHPQKMAEGIAKIIKELGFGNAFKDVAMTTPHEIETDGE